MEKQTNIHADVHKKVHRTSRISNINTEMDRAIDGRTERMKIGIMGGSFDPIHHGHLLAAEHAAEAADLDEVWFIPSHAAPHKDQRPRASDEDRLHMVKLAIASNRRFRLLDWEIRRGGVSYSIETAEMLRQTYASDEFYWLIGADMVQYLPYWHRIEELCRLLRFIGFARPCTTIDMDELKPEIRDSVQIVQIPLIEISSTEIRRRIAAGRSIRYMVPEPVLEYIEERRLYGS